MSFQVNINSDNVENKEISNPHPSVLWQNLAAELVFIQDQSGKYWEFFWESAQNYGINPQEILENSGQNPFEPIAPETYYQRLERVLKRRIPEQCSCLFEYVGQKFPLELIFTPILPIQGQPTKVLVIGHLLSDEDLSLTHHTALPTHLDPYQKLLTSTARKIRRTLNLETIWQQTVEGLGLALQVSRCLMISIAPNYEDLDVQAEYCESEFPSVLGRRIKRTSEPYWEQALIQREPVIVEQLAPDLSQAQSILIISTFYQNQRNGLIVLQQCDRRRYWQPAEIELIQELADQVGTAIAHATLYQELEQATLAAEEASRLKSDFLASTTHELRTPLNGIIGFLRLLIDGMADDAQEQQEFLEEAHKSAIHLLNLINDILDIAKIEAGKMELELGSVELVELLKTVNNFTLPQAQSKQLSYTSKIPATLTPIILYGNYQRLLQVILNLVSNAIKFTHEGGIEISAEIVKKKINWQDRQFPGMIKVRVADTGIGVSLEKQAKLFEKFVQVQGSHTRTYGGTGLGLAISQRLIEAMGGQVEFFSMGEGLGSTVTFTVPLEQMPIVKT
ncbi:MAG TPA: histidine kinase [Cyanothece sp. UBA12306]|nr:histidine kinase [Cyanothece sp. UBA12306]